MRTHGKICNLYRDKILKFIRMCTQMFSFLLNDLENGLTKEKKNKFLAADITRGAPICNIQVR